MQQFLSGLATPNCYRPLLRFDRDSFNKDEDVGGDPMMRRIIGHHEKSGYSRRQEAK